MATRLANPGLRRRLGEQGRAAFEQRWTPEAHLTGYFAVIDELRNSAIK